MTTISRFGRKDRKSLRVAVAKKPSTSAFVEGWLTATPSTAGMILARFSSVVSVDMKATTGDQKRKMSTRQAQPTSSPTLECSLPWARSCHCTSSGSGGMLTANSSTSARYCSFEASRCQNSEVKVTKPVGETTEGSFACTALSTTASSSATDLSASSRSISQCATRARSSCLAPPCSQRLSSTRSWYFTVVSLCSFFRSFGVLRATYAETTASSLKTSTKYAFKASSDWKFVGMFSTMSVLALGSGMSFSHAKRRSEKSLCACSTSELTVRTTSQTMKACTQKTGQPGGRFPMSILLRVSKLWGV
mmetsp:Transcript_122528/g.357797  ORF Transcript_122528/g.357797 Transcript_122528/m.357797 type:complete len:306 (+) Transcript_122528:1502-2419(+)